MLAIVYMLAFTAAGIDMGNRVLYDRPPQVRMWLGAVFGLIAQIWLPAIAAFFVGFTVLAQAIACAVMAALWAVVFWRVKTPRAALTEGDRLDLTALGIWGLPLTGIMLVLFCNHVLAPGSDGGLWVGQSTYGDLALHLGIVTSIAYQGFWPPLYSILPGTPLGYPFLVDSWSSTLVLLGLPLRWAVIVPSLLMTALCFAGFFIFLADALGDRRRTVLAFLLFFLTGGLGFLFFLNGARAEGSMFSQIFTAFYHTPTNYPAWGLRWVNVLCDMMVPQRATLLGWSVLPAGLYLAWKGCVQGSRRDAVAGGLVAAAMPMMHTHSFLALGIVCAGWLFSYWRRQRDKKAYVLNWLLFLTPVVLLATPQLMTWTFSQSASQGFLRVQPGWVIDQDTPIWFWVKNVGLPFVVLAPALIHRWRERLPWYSGAAAIFILCHIVVFQPNTYDNNKLLYVWYLFTAAVAADFLVLLWEKLKGLPGRSILAGLVIVGLFASAGLTIAREWISGASYQLLNADDVALAEYVKDHTAPDALVLTGENHNNAVAMLSGRDIYVGTATFLYYHGFVCDDLRANVRQIYTDPDAAARLPGELGIDYILVSRHEQGQYGVSAQYFDPWYPLVFERGGVRLYAVIDGSGT